MNDQTGSDQIDDIIELHGGWKAEIVSRIRGIVLAADPDAVEEVKWRMKSRPEGLPVWSHDGILCYVEIFKNDLKLVFFKGAHMEDYQSIFNARLKSLDTRAIEFHDGDAVPEAAIKTLVKEAIRLNLEKKGKKS